MTTNPDTNGDGFRWDETLRQWVPAYGSTSPAQLAQDRAFSSRFLAGRVPVPTGFAFNTLTADEIPPVFRLGKNRFFADTAALVASIRPPAGVTYYVSPTASVADGLTPATPTTIADAIAKPDIGTIAYLPGEYFRTATSTPTNKSLNWIATAPGVRLTNWNDPASTTWTVHSGHIYTTSRSNTLAVWDVNNRTAWGDFTRYVQRADAASITGPGEFAIVGSNVFVWAIGNTNLTVAGNRAQIRLLVSGVTGVLITGGNHYVRGITFEGCPNNSGIDVNGSTARVVFEDCSAKYAFNTNGVNVDTAAVVVLIRCDASSNDVDGFNLNGGADVIEVDCTSHHNGVYFTPASQNASSAHDTVRVMRVGGNYYDCAGPVVVDVGTSRSWNLGCRSGGSSLATFGASWTITGGQMWCDECTADTSPVAIRTLSGGVANLRGFTWTNPNALYTLDPTFAFNYY